MQRLNLGTYTFCRIKLKLTVTGTLSDAIHRWVQIRATKTIIPEYCEERMIAWKTASALSLM